ncbi:superkiller complex protein 3 [Cydia splendana]|uniref:superkiller complex protein 3 n=1 Tax=Cydia splendana TaxID=1100963 RepID=UPI00300D151B
MADTKALLKEARKLIDDNNYKDAQECCKNILRKDKQNYIALVLLGKSLQDADQASLAYQKAIASKPDHPLAWHGLANYYERKDDESSKTKLITVYDEILKLQIEEDKALEIITKLGQLGCHLKSNEAVTTLLHYKDKVSDAKSLAAVEYQILELVKSGISCKEEDILPILKLLDQLYIKDPSSSLELLYAKVILQKSDYAKAVDEIIGLQFFSQNVVLREFLCKHICNRYVRDKSFNNIPIESLVDKITDGIENSKYPGLLKCMICFDKSEYLEAYKQCIPLINYQQAEITEATFIIKCAMMLEKWPVVQKLATNFLLKAKEPNFVLDLKRYLFLSLAKQRKWKQAISTASEIPIGTSSISEQAILAECYIETNENAEQIMEQLQSSEYHLQLQALFLLKQQKYAETVTLLQNLNDNPLCMFYLGKALWKLKDYEKSQINLLKAARLNPHHPETFLYLGHFYHDFKNDLEKSKKCYEKAHSLDSTNPKITRKLSEVYTKLELREADFELLIAAEKNTQESWLNFRLGLHYMSKRLWENAVVQFRNVIKSDQSNITAFECLADAYFSRGSYTSALRAYNKVMTANPSRSSHCLTKIGNIHSLLTQYEDAIATYENVLKIDANSMLALKGIAETWMRIAKKKVMAKVYGSARDCAQQAINYLIKALQKQKQFICLWKLLADTLIFVTTLPNKYAYAYMTDLLVQSDENIQTYQKLDIFPKVIACYSLVAKKNQQSASYELASSYFAFYQESRKLVNCHIAYKLTLQCIKEKPSHWRNWNLLGKICQFIKKFDLAQHCFIKALLVTRKWSVAKIWCNLGTLYLKLNHHKLANYCFWRGQSTLPSYPLSWIGQALIAEVIREEEAMDLLRHASRLGYHPESALGYADWVCRTLKKSSNYKENSELKYVIDGLHAIPYAIDLVEWYSTFEPNNACACTILGILQERFGLIRVAFKSYEKALQYADDENRNITFLNMGRILMRMERYDEAVKVYKAITEASLDSTCGLALALYKKGLYEESYAAYDAALHWLSNDDDDKADILVAMAGIVYMYKGADDAKTLLFHSIQISQKKPTPYSLFAICSLGLIHSDQSLSKLAVSEMHKYEMDSNFGFDIGFLKSYVLLCDENIDGAVKLLSDSLHDHPSNALLWFCMSQYCLRESNKRAKVASSCAQRALCLAHYGECKCNPAEIISTASIAEHFAGNQAKALLLAKEGLHMYPNQSEIWAALLFSLLPHKKWTERKDWLLAAAGHMRKHLEISRSLSRWVNLIEKKLSR